MFSYFQDSELHSRGGFCGSPWLALHQQAVLCSQGGSAEWASAEDPASPTQLIGASFNLSGCPQGGGREKGRKWKGESSSPAQSPYLVPTRCSARTEPLKINPVTCWLCLKGTISSGCFLLSLRWLFLLRGLAARSCLDATLSALNFEGKSCSTWCFAL